MKVLIVCHYFAPHTGGIENVAYNQALALIKKRHSVTVVTSRISREKETASIDGIRVRRVKAFNILEKLFGIPYPLFVPHLASLMKHEIEKADVVLIHGHVYIPSVIAAYYANKLKRPSLVIQHNTFIHYTNPVFKLLQTAADLSLGRYTLGSSKKIVAVSRETKKYVQRIIGKNVTIETIYNGVNTNRFRAERNKVTLRKKFGIPGNVFVCLTVRRLTFKNGIETFLNVAKLADQDKTLFLLGGAGPDKDKISEFIRRNGIKNITMLGFVSDGDLSSYYALSDVFILPSMQGEGFPMVVLEAFASGIPVIATRSGGHVEIIKNAETGFIVDINKPLQIHRKIEYLLSNKRVVKTMSRNCRALVEKSLSWRHNVNHLIKLVVSV